MNIGFVGKMELNYIRAVSGLVQPDVIIDGCNAHYKAALRHTPGGHSGRRGN
jgi:6-phosphogluconate dehydrogenase (decarboxylating)